MLDIERGGSLIKIILCPHPLAPSPLPYHIAPYVNITPSAIALLPGDTRANLQCITNNPRLPIFWTTSLASDAQILSTMANFTVMVPPGGLEDETKYYCSVRDPENQSVGVDNRVMQNAAVVTNIPGIWQCHFP